MVAEGADIFSNNLDSVPFRVDADKHHGQMFGADLQRFGGTGNLIERRGTKVRAVGKTEINDVRLSETSRRNSSPFWSTSSNGAPIPIKVLASQRSSPLCQNAIAVTERASNTTVAAMAAFPARLNEDIDKRWRDRCVTSSPDLRLRSENKPSRYNGPKTEQFASSITTRIVVGGR